KAMVMLKNRKGNVGDVAAMVGFGSESYFSRAFKERFGIPPSQAM
ncbi:MAG: AraC family transcriptional regulator, partial [Saprospiraceae bacterium]|nr:AraC family transcriptional regulator [Saprospiraceae bacterium]